MTEPTYGLTPEQHAYLLNPLRRSRVAKRSQGGKELSYLEAWDVKAHLTRIFGFGNWDSEMIDYKHVIDRPYQSNQQKDMVEVVYSARIRLTIRNAKGYELCTHMEAAVGSASGPANMLGDHHDNALKTAASDALKRCAINLGTQFGLSLYDNGSTQDVIKNVLVAPVGVAVGAVPAQKGEDAPTDEQAAKVLAESLGATEVSQIEAGPPTQEEVNETMGDALGRKGR